jgi:hypothetical protein
MEHIYNLADKIKNILPQSTNEDEKVIDISKTFSSQNCNVEPIIRKILELPDIFPNNILHSIEGHKYNELEFFKTNLDSNVDPNNKSLFDKFNKTSTLLGKSLLQNIILNPTVDIKLLQTRQNIIQQFIKHPNFTNICNLATECATIEKDFLAMQLEDTPEMLEVYKVIFFEFKPLKFLNYHQLFLKLFYYFLIIFSPIYGIVAPIAFIFTPYFFMKYILKIPITFDMFYTIVKNMIVGGTGFFSNLGKILNSKAGESITNMIGGGESKFTIKNIIINLAKWLITFMNSSAGTVIYFGFLLISYLYGIYNTFQISITYNKVINMFHSRLNIISKWLKNVIICYNLKLGFEYPEMKNVILQINQLLPNPTIQNLLEHSTFESEPGILSNKGIIIKTFREFLDNKTLLEPFGKYMAYIDLWSGIGKWFIQNNNTSMCNYQSESNEPLVIGSNVWNICCDKPVFNDVQLGQNSSGEDDKPSDITENFNNLLITGPNGSGKSTYIKSIIESIILGQTIGVVPAKQLKITPFKHISTYLNIPDCQGKESLFQAEMNRCYQQLQILKESEEKGEFSFSIMDEIFVSTNYQEGMSGAYAVIKRMCNMNKCINVITTHFDVLASMDEVKVCKKYFDIEMNDTDKIIKDYKIKNGVSKKHMALKLLKQKGFDPEIINDAEYLYEKLQNIQHKTINTSGEDEKENDNEKEDEIINTSGEDESEKENEKENENENEIINTSGEDENENETINTSG